MSDLVDAIHLDYAKATSPAERRRLQAAAVEAYRDRVSRVVRRLVPGAANRPEGEQVGAIGILVALERVDASRVDSRFSFWAFAYPYVRYEIQRWLDVGVYWRRVGNRGKDAARQAQRQAAAVNRRHASMDSPISDGRASDWTNAWTLHDMLHDTSPTAEDMVAEVEVTVRLRAFASGLSDLDREILLSENSQRVRSRHYSDLVARAAAFLRGPNADDDPTARHHARGHRK